MAKRKKRHFARPLTISLVVLCILAIASYYASDYFYTRSFVHYPGFGIDLPVKYKVHGIDVSRYQRSIRWDDVKEMKVQDVHIAFAFIKATEGINRQDERFEANWNGCRKAGIIRGAYHYFIASKSGRAQAVNFIESVNLQQGDMPPVVDVEETFGTSLVQLQQRLADYIQIIETAYHVKPIIYTGADFYEAFLAGRFDEYPLWVAHYLVKDKPRVERGWSFWQHSERGHVNGIRTNVDFNVFNGDSIQFKKLLIK